MIQTMNEFLKEKTFNKKIIYFRYLCFFYILIKIDSETFVVLINTCEKPKKKIHLCKEGIHSQKDHFSMDLNKITTKLV